MTMIRIGTRGSQLALKQAEIIKSKLQECAPDRPFDIVKISTQGDLDKKTSLAELGGKGVFIKALEQSLCDEQIDIAVHSFKDVTASLAPGCSLAGFISPESEQDVLVMREGESPFDGMLIGTGSLRRKALLQHQFDHAVSVKDIRGNIDTRLQKVDDGEVDAVLLSEAGLIRLNLQHRVTQAMPVSRFYPAPGQGVIALECRDDQPDMQALCRQLTNPAQAIVSACHLQVLTGLGFDCRDPLGCYVSVDSDTFTIEGFVSPLSCEELALIKVKGQVSDHRELTQEWIEKTKEKRQQWQ